VDGDPISLPEAQPILRSHLPALARSMAQAVRTLNDLPNPSPMALDATGQATFLSQHFYYFASVNMDGDPRIRFRKDQLQRYIVVDERLILRFKKFDVNLRARNYPTEHARHWVTQIPLKGLPEVERLELGYRPDLTGTAIQYAFIILPHGEINEWVWQIWGDPAEPPPGIQIRMRPPSPNPPMPYAYDDFSHTG
jgi:hypothetical protein